jgi:hypothetical protein
MNGPFENADIKSGDTLREIDGSEGEKARIARRSLTHDTPFVPWWYVNEYTRYQPSLASVGWTSHVERPT